MQTILSATKTWPKNFRHEHPEVLHHNNHAGPFDPAMQSMPLLLRHSIRPSLHLSRASRPIRTQLPPTAPSPFSAPWSSPRDFSVCLRCQFRNRPAWYSPNESDRGKDEHAPSERKDEVDPAAKPEVQAAEQRSQSHPEESENAQGPAREREQGQGQGQAQEHKQDIYHEANPDPTESGHGLPSSMESRRPHWSKQFSSMMDNVQSNVFVAGQRLNDLTGYSSIEALKKDIHAQEERLRNARAHVREAKDSYTTAINRRSTSQREVNELLQRKHAWSSADLERFTHLYRNDHANEVAESETQESFSAAEREAEEAAANLSKSILSRYHEEQIWSDKIRRMSTWGTWGLMGVNVLLFVIFQIAVEPWRRRRLVKGFEEKVLEALEEKDKAIAGDKTTTADVDADANAEADAITSIHPPSAPSEKEEPLDSSSSIPSTSDTVPVANETPTADAPAVRPDTPDSHPPETTPASATASSMSQLSRFSSLPPTSVESWRNTLHDLFSERSFAITQRDLTTVAIQSAAAGAAVMGLVIALIRPR
ncbi:hypothetical protein PHISP_01703 [Aspergillus sp. HF37]|nr:hypothetical protein PHISP_01703 [Aspergillus sp. HF37]